MAKDVDLVTASTGLGVATYVAIMIGYVARHDLGFSTGQIRSAAMIGAVTIGLAIVLDLLGRRPGKAG